MHEACIYDINEDNKFIERFTKCLGTLEDRPVEIRSTKKRSSYLSWSDTFMAVAKVVAMRSKDPKTQVGACIVNQENRIVSVGYNGMPNGCDDDEFPWGKGSDLDDDKHLYVCHAETNAIHNRNTSSLKGCTMYVTLFPCNECAKHIIQSAIKQVFYLYDKDPDKKSTLAAKRMFRAAGVSFFQFEPSESGSTSKIEINLSIPQWHII